MPTNYDDEEEKRRLRERHDENPLRKLKHPLGVVQVGDTAFRQKRGHKAADSQIDSSAGLNDCPAFRILI